MLVLVLSAVPAGVRGHVTRWLLEISPGVFVGSVSRRVREALWEEIRGSVRTGRAILVWQSNSEQGLEFLVHGHHWEPVDFDGITLMMRPHQPSGNSARVGSSNASKWRRYGRRSNR